MSPTPAQPHRENRRGPLYRQLTPRPHGPSREAVAGNQRARLFGAIAESVAARGYEATSVAEVSRLAGVSKRTFYEQFENKQACFAAAFDDAVGCAGRRVAAAWAQRAGWEPGIQDALRALLTALAERPQAARLALLDAASVEPLHPRVHSAWRSSELALAACFADSPSGVALSPVLAHGLACGLRRVARRHLLSGTAARLPQLAAPLAAWVAGYACSELPALPLPRATAGSGPRLTGERARIVRAAAELVAETGSSRLSSVQIVERAGVARARFDERYASAEECMRDAVEVAGLEVLVAAGAALRGGGAWPLAVHRAVAAVLEQLARDRVLARLAVVVAAAPAPLDGTAERLLRGFSELLAGPVPRELLPGEAVLDALTGAAWGMVSQHIRHAPLHRLPELAAHATYLVLAPAVGPAAAVATLEGEALAIAA